MDDSARAGALGVLGLRLLRHTLQGSKKQDADGGGGNALEEVGAIRNPQKRCHDGYFSACFSGGSSSGDLLLFASRSTICGLGEMFGPAARLLRQPARSIGPIWRNWAESG